MRDKPTLLCLWAILFNEALYNKLRDDVYQTLEKRHEQTKHLDPGLAPRAAKFRRDFWTSFAVAILAIAIAAVWACGAGQFTVNPAYEFKWGKFLSAVGNVLMAWPTWLMLADPQPTYKGWLLDETLRPYVFRWLFFPGLVLTLAGGIWADITLPP